MILEIICLCLVVFIVYSKLTKRPIGMPPGDWGLPVFGKLPKGKLGLTELIATQRKKYGNIFSVKIGSRIVVFLADYNLIKTCFSKNEFSGRPDSFCFSSISFFTGYGIGVANGRIWHHNRCFAVKALGDFGMGKSKIENFIEYEVTELLSVISKSMNVPVDIAKFFQIAVLNNIWQLVANKRYCLTDTEIIKFSQASMRLDALLGGTASILDFLPWLNYLPSFIKNRWLRVDEIKEHSGTLQMLMETEIEAHKKSFDKNKIRDLIDMYLLDIEEINDPEDYFKKDLRNLSATIANLFMGGSDTTTLTLLWFCIYMSKYPEIQEKIHKEIDNEVGKDRRPCLTDRDNLTYLEATLYELHRNVSLLPNNFFHKTTEDAELEGFQIPKGTYISACFEACHKSPEYFDDPEVFRPERFLTSDGKVDTKKEGFLPFSIGRRSCIGEALAKTELFLFTSAILQKFRVTVPENYNNSEIDLSPDPNDPFFNHPKPHLFVFQQR